MLDRLTRADTARRQADRLAALRLRFAINVHLEDQGLNTPAAVGAAVGGWACPADAEPGQAH